MLIWKDELAIGIDLIDTQHKHLFEIGNRAYELMINDFSPDKYEEIVQIIDDLRQYAQYHFKSEEEYMLEIKYPKYFSQKVEHDDFIKKINEIDFYAIDNNQKKYLQDTLAFVFDWVLHHILEKDMDIKTFVPSKV